MSASPLPAGCLRLFGLPFLLAGLGLSLYGLFMFYTYFQSASWDKVKGTVISAEIKTHEGSEDTTYSLDGLYEFTYRGQKYESRKFAIEGGSSSAYNEKKKQLAVLEKAIRNNTPVDVYVNPRNPHKSFVFREISMVMVMITGMGLVFAMVGFAFVGGWIKPPSITASQLQSLSAGEPWKADPRWTGFILKTGIGKGLAGLWAFAAFFTIFVGTFVGVLIMDSGAPIFAWAVVLVFVVIALAIDVAAVYTTLQYRKFGDSSLVLSQFPLVPGFEFAAVMAVQSRFSAGQAFDFELLCEHKHITGSGKNSHTKIDKVYSYKTSVNVQSQHFQRKHIFVPVKLRIPEDAQQVTPDFKNPSLTWKLKAAASVPGVDFAAEFPLPVYNVSSPEQIKYKAESESI